MVAGLMLKIIIHKLGTNIEQTFEGQKDNCSRLNFDQRMRIRPA
jgi:hypothetical protein